MKIALNPTAHAFRLPVLGLLALTLLIGLTYGLALPGFLLFDDIPNLDGLHFVNGLDSALQYILAGDSGPTGRPLALLSFALQAEAWPDDSGAFLRVNFLIHLCAVWAAFFLALGLARVRDGQDDRRALWIALAVAALWGLSPFLATTHLMIVQRMTSLAGFFVLSGLAAFVWAQQPESGEHTKRRFVLLAYFAASMLLGTLAKENATLMPLFALLIMGLWIPPRQRLPYPWLVFLLLILPSLLVLGYLLQALLNTLEHGYGAHRYFTPFQRTLSQPVILLDYLRQLLLPQAGAVSPFMDQLPVAKGWLDPPSSLWASLFWLALTAAALFWRRAAPALFFGLMFFFVGHLLESSFLGLELYFAHRNYIPAFGLYFALVYVLLHLPSRFDRLVKLGLSAYVLLFVGVLFQVTSGWNQVHINTLFWLERNPHSVRAVQVLANQRISQNDFAGARVAFDQAARFNPKIATLQITRTKYCQGREGEFPHLLQEVSQQLKTAAYDLAAAADLFNTAYGDPAATCSARNYQAMAQMAEALLANPVYANSNAAKALLFATLGLAAERGAANLAQAIVFYKQAFDFDPTENHITLTALAMARAGEFEQAYDFLNQAKQRLDKQRGRDTTALGHFDKVRSEVDKMRLRAGG
jgi:tetratricopeptide (TPR) repeat protein